MKFIMKTMQVNMKSVRGIMKTMKVADNQIFTY